MKKNKCILIVHITNRFKENSKRNEKKNTTRNRREIKINQYNEEKKATAATEE